MYLNSTWNRVFSIFKTIPARTRLNFSRGLMPAVHRGDEEAVKAILDAALPAEGHSWPPWADVNMSDPR